MDSIVIRGAREHNLKNIDVVVPRNKFVVITGVSGSGKSSLAFDTIFAEGQRRYVESLSRVRPAVSRADGEAGRRLDRGTLARDFHRAAHHVAQSALDRRHRHRDLRLPAPPLRLGRRAALHELRPGDPAADDSADGRPPADAAGRHEVHHPRAVHPRQEGRVPQADAADGEGRLHARRRRRRRSRAVRSADARQAEEAHHRRAHRPHRRQGRHPAAPRRFARNGHARVEGAGQDPLPGRQPRGADVAVVLLPRLRRFHRRDHAAPLLLQLALRRLPALLRPRRSARSRREEDHPRLEQVGRRRRHRHLERRRRELAAPPDSHAGQALQVQDRHAVARAAGEGARR